MNRSTEFFRLCKAPPRSCHPQRTPSMVALQPPTGFVAISSDGHNFITLDAQPCPSPASPRTQVFDVPDERLNGSRVYHDQVDLLLTADGGVYERMVTPPEPTSFVDGRRCR